MDSRDWETMISFVALSTSATFLWKHEEDKVSQKIKSCILLKREFELNNHQSQLSTFKNISWTFEKSPSCEREKYFNPNVLKDLEMRGSTRFLNQKKPLIVISDVKTTFFDFLPVELTNPSDFSTRFFWFWPFRNWSLIWFWPGAISRYFFLAKVKNIKRSFHSFFASMTTSCFHVKVFFVEAKTSGEKKSSPIL